MTGRGQPGVEPVRELLLEVFAAGAEVLRLVVGRP
jgi:hypothetical protein